MPRASPIGAWSSATSGRSGGTTTSSSPVNGHVTRAYSGCIRSMPVPLTPRTGRNDTPISAARSWVRIVTQQLSRASIAPVAAARR